MSAVNIFDKFYQLLLTFELNLIRKKKNILI